MKRPLFAACIVAATTMAVGARSEPTEDTFSVPTTAALAELCADTSSSNAMMTTAAQNFCRGYLLGAYHILAQVNAARGKRAFCIPSPSPTRNQAIAEFVAWAKASPSGTSLPPADGVYEFLTQRFPCPGNS
jgi:Rap1a immunity proteins